MVLRDSQAVLEGKVPVLEYILGFQGDEFVGDKRVGVVWDGFEELGRVEEGQMRVLEKELLDLSVVVGFSPGGFSYQGRVKSLFHLDGIEEG